MAETDSVLFTIVSGGADSPNEWRDPEARRKALERIDYHGVSGLLVAERKLPDNWPDELIGELRGRATGQAMWELRHRALLCELLAAFASREVVAILLKGTAIAYDLYEEPSARARGDTDIYVPRPDIPQARSILEGLGFEQVMEGSLMPDGLRLQEAWTIRTADGQEHCIDLHWAVLNSHALADLFTESECRAAARRLPRLCETALALDRPRMLTHACVHRQLHVTAPYFVEDRTYYGGDRLIWFRDIFLLADSLSERQLDEFLRIADHKGVFDICRGAVSLAYEQMGLRPPQWARTSSPVIRTRASAYLKASQSRRALMDLRAVAGLRAKLAYFAAQALPNGALVRAKYPGMRSWPIPFLYARRFAELLLPRPGHGRD